MDSEAGKNWGTQAYFSTSKCHRPQANEVCRKNRLGPKYKMCYNLPSNLINILSQETTYG